MTTVYFAGNEDIDFILFAGMAVNTGGGRFRPSFARSSFGDLGGGAPSEAHNATPFTATNPIWGQGRFCNSFPSGAANNSVIMNWRDVNQIERLRFRLTSAGGPTNTYVVEKITAAGVTTTLFSGTIIWDTPATGNEASALTWHINYAVAGSVEVFYKGLSIGSFSGDVTTDSVTSLAYMGVRGTGGGNNCFWSEMMVVDFDCRAVSLQGFAPVANGNTHNFDTGTPAAANVNENPINLTTLDGSTTAGQIDEYTTGAVATGTFDVIAYGVSAMMSKGASGPSKADLAVRTGGADFFSADIALTTFYTGYQNWWLTNPNTGVAWLTSQIGSAAGFNIGIKSVT